MKSPRERTVLVSVLVIAGLGFAADRIVIGSDVTGPAETSAGVIDLAVDPASLLIDPEQPEGPAEDAGPSLAELLRDATAGYAAGEAGSRDAFSVPAAWKGVSSDGAGTLTGALSAEAFRSKNALDAVLVTGDQRCAVINGQTIFVGEELDGYRLLTVHERSVEFESSGVRVVLGIRGGGKSS